MWSVRFNIICKVYNILLFGFASLSVCVCVCSGRMDVKFQAAEFDRADRQQNYCTAMPIFTCRRRHRAGVCMCVCTHARRASDLHTHTHTHTLKHLLKSVVTRSVLSVNDTHVQMCYIYTQTCTHTHTHRRTHLGARVCMRLV